MPTKAGSAIAAGYNTLMLGEIRKQCKDQPRFDLSVLAFPPAVLDPEGQMYADRQGLKNSALNTPPGLNNDLRAALIDVGLVVGSWWTASLR